MRVFILLILFVVSSNVLAAETVVALSAEQLAQKHEESVAACFPVSLKMVHEQTNYFGDRPVGASVTSLPWIWARRAGEERLFFQLPEPSQRGLPVGLYDYSVKEGKVLFLKNWDPERPQELCKQFQGTVRAQISPQNGEFPGRDVSQFLNWTFSLGKDLKRSTLSELVKENSGVEIVGEKVVEGLNCVVLKIPDPDRSEGYVGGDYFLVALARERKFSCVQVIEHIESIPGQVNGKQESYRMETTRTVKSWSDRGNGIFIPQLVETQVVSNSSDKRRSVVRTTITEIKTGAEVEEAAFAFSFPEGVFVKITDQNNPKTVDYVVWEKGRPGMSIIPLKDFLHESLSPSGRE